MVSPAYEIQSTGGEKRTGAVIKAVILTVASFNE